MTSTTSVQRNGVPDGVAPPNLAEPEVLLDVVDLVKTYRSGHGLLARRRPAVQALRGVNLQVQRGETLGLVGESGCGKSTLGRCLLGGHRPDSGRIDYTGQDGSVVDLAQLGRRGRKPYRTQIRTVFQDPNSSLNPRMTVRQIIAEPLVALGGVDRREIGERVAEALRRVGLRPEYMTRYPHSFSGGQRQRIGIARALITEPRLVVADEAVSALDVSVRSQILNLMEDLQEQLDLTYLFISHDLSVIQHLCDRVAVMYLGSIVEEAATEELFERPRHPYTESLLRALPIPDPRLRQRRSRVPLRGELPDPSQPPSGCTFHTRCPYVVDRCRTVEPPLLTVGPDSNRLARCHRVAELDLVGVNVPS